MGKLKQRQQVVIPKSKDDTLSDISADRDDSWVIVKKQRVTILIPPLPHANKLTVPKPRPDNLEVMTVKVINTKSTIPVEVPNQMPSIDVLEKVASRNPPRLNVQTEYENPARSHGFKSHNMLSVSNYLKTTKQPRLVHHQGRFFNGRVLLNQSLRALLLEKKLQKAGGLSRWLASIGLGQFVKIFQGNISKFQLVNLTMKKLKDMGADPVGPRRKLMHAIDCICQPYCFEAS